ncbi:MAG: EscU/YscU/HrcU family type III secretion system export apparatus switch protein [Clostridiales bacterium]|nr:EscU/YscU/HrcU family type III secretion system export apparatus switch protein [Clostridiales bacterium]
MPKKKKAVALKYNLEQDLAPVVIASGYGEVAERIINVAEERGIPVYRDDSAASMLCMLEVGAAIPEDLYQVVATIYIQIMETANRIKEGSISGGERVRTPAQANAEQRERFFGPGERIPALLQDNESEGEEVEESEQTEESEQIGESEEGAGYEEEDESDGFTDFSEAAKKAEAGESQ